MSLFLVFTVAFSLAMDAFAVSVGLGIKHPNYRTAYALKVAFMFGAFQAVMPIIGWYLGDQFVTFMSRYDHWVIFVVLAVIGIKMIYEGMKGKGRGTDTCKSTRECESIKVLLLLSLATSIDALAAGFGFAFLHSNIFLPAAIIGIVTFVLSFFGTALGYYIGSRFKRVAEVIGGSVLFLLGLNILIKHLSVL